MGCLKFCVPSRMNAIFGRLVGVKRGRKTQVRQVQARRKTEDAGKHPSAGADHLSGGTIQNPKS